ncbi:hypothetical protein C8Q76DRAFT_799403 [Earliella scabrosa]|nr:hypothetical protein C8Q76DRAFT_799403 [Earliella scabrosa]
MYDTLASDYYVVLDEGKGKRKLNRRSRRLRAILPLHAEIRGIIADELDLVSLLHWRAVCKDNYQEATASLHRTLNATLRPFFTSSSTFLRLLSRSKAVVTGIVALAFLLRDTSIFHGTLEVHAASFWYARLVDELSNTESTALDIDRIVKPEIQRRYCLDRDIAEETVFHLRNGTIVVVQKTSMVSPCSAISRSPSTALMCFLTEHTFGCAYPRLTFDRRSLLADVRLNNLSSTDRSAFNALLQAKFSFAVSPTAWPEYRVTDAEPARSNTHLCLRRQYLCPQQGRYFGDPGSFVDFHDPLDFAHNAARTQSIPPFGPMVAWRLLNSFECAEGCDGRDPVLHEWLISTPIVFLPNPFTRQLGIPNHALRVEVQRTETPRRRRPDLTRAQSF